MTHRLRAVFLLGAAAIVLAATLRVTAQLAVSANDAKIVLVDGVQTVVANPPPDTVTVIDLGASPVRVVAELRVPASVIGPPSSVAITPDQSLALVTASMKVDAADASRTVPDDTVTVIDLKASPPALLAAVHAGRGASGIAINPAGTLALVANRTDGTVSVFSIAGRAVTAAGTIELAPDSWPSGIAITPDGRRAFVTRNNDSLVSMLAIDGGKVTYTKTDFAAGLKPYGIDITPAGDTAIVASIGAGPSGGADTLAVVDLTLTPPRTVHYVTAGPTIEGVRLSPDGRFVAATVMNGSQLAKASPFHHAGGTLRVFAVGKQTLTPVADAPIGRWCQGAAWSRDGRTILVQCAADREIRVLGFDGRALKAGTSIKINGGPVGIAAGR